MDTKYLIRIAVGALVVFVAGLGAFQMVRGGRHVANYGREVIDSLKHGSGPVAVRLPFVPVFVDGQRLGTLDSVVLLRHERDSIEGLRVVMKPGDGGAQERLATCTIEIASLENLDLAHAFTCAGDTVGLAPFGIVVADHKGHPLFVRKSELHSAGWNRVRMEALSLNIDSLTAHLDSLAQQIEADVRWSVEQSVRPPSPPPPPRR